MIKRKPHRPGQTGLTASRYKSGNLHGSVSQAVADVSRETLAGPLIVRGPDDFAGAFDVSRETLARLQTYAALLAKWQKTINLVSPKTLTHVWQRHFADSAQLYRLIPSGAQHLMDIGSGGGFPGLVLAIMAAEEHHSGLARPSPRVTLVESDARKCAFLREVARQTGIAVDIMSTRIETISNCGTVAPVDVIASRALAALPLLFELVEPIFAPGSLALFLKGRTAEDEVAEARRSWDFKLELKPSLTMSEARIAVIRDLKRRKEG